MGIPLLQCLLDTYLQVGCTDRRQGEEEGAEGHMGL